MSIWDEKPELVDRLRKLVREGVTAEQAARMLGHGLTKDAVVSKSARMMLRLTGNVRRRTHRQVHDARRGHGKPVVEMGWNSPYGRSDRHRFTAAEDQQIIDMVLDDRINREIAAALGLRERLIDGRITFLRRHGFITHNRSKARDHHRRRPSRSAVTNLPLGARQPVELFRDIADAKAPAPNAIDGKPVTLANAGPGHCRWPHGDPAAADFHLCGHNVAGEGESYCAYHRRKAFRKPSPAEAAAERPPKLWRGTVAAGL
jgi:hypothetical protein